MRMGPGILLIVAFVVMLGISVRVRSRRKRGIALAAQWNHLQQQRGRRGSGDLLHVTQVYQHARRGSKALITWCDTGHHQDAWFWDWHVPSGAYLLVNASSGYGPHNKNANVLYVHPTQVTTWVPAQAPIAAQRQTG
ncbi:hypothetical protein [Streptomyces sp. NPDC056401]|uniref:hypothetical protein n=1 Tax=Streptomyces sp. NPDC056401 TaxID=3345809 RepID=UPI0035D8565F